MNPRKKLYAPFALLILSVFIVSCAARQAKKLIGEGNAAVKESEKFITDANAELMELIDGLADFPQNRDQLRPSAQTALDNLDKGIAKLREAASKFDEASKINLDAPLKEYLSLKSQEFSKHAEHLETMKGIPTAFLDTSIKDNNTLQAKFAEVKERLGKLEQEWTDLAARANKIRQENKDKFES
jgi:chromosome segregation ATPase